MNRRRRGRGHGEGAEDKQKTRWYGLDTADKEVVWCGVRESHRKGKQKGRKAALLGCGEKRKRKREAKDAYLGGILRVGERKNRS